MLLFLLFSIIAILIAGYYDIIPSPWIEESTRTMDTRDKFVNKSADLIESEAER
jgi:hypothetical protein